MTVLYIDYEKGDWGISDWMYIVTFKGAKSWPVKYGDKYDMDSLEVAVSGFAKRALRAYKRKNLAEMALAEKSITRLVDFYNQGEQAPTVNPFKPSMTCPDCGFEVNISKKDDSFDHHFGTEHIVYWGTDCCGVEVDYEEF